MPTAPLCANPQYLFQVMLVIEVLFAIPVGLTLKRMGFSSWWALLCFIPIVALFALWLLAFVKWPKGAQTQV